MEEELVNEFEAAYQSKNYAAVADILRVARSELRNRRNLAVLLPIREIIDLLLLPSADDTSSLTDMKEEAGLLLEALLANADFASLLPTFGGSILATLRSSDPTLLHLGIAFVERALSASMAKDLPPGVFDTFISLLMHPDAHVASQVSRCKIFQYFCSLVM
jgi:hypothetical protein